MFTKLKELQAQLNEAMAEMRNSVAKKLDETAPIMGVTTLDSGTALVSLSSIKNNGLILSPSYYIPSMQADAVKDRLLDPKLSFDEFKTRLKNAIETQRIKSGNETIYLNTNTLKTLENIQANI